MQKTMVYRSPASDLKNAAVDKTTGETYEFKVVDAESPTEDAKSELDLALESGWYDSPKAAIEAVPSVEDGTPPTRAEMEQKARELNIDFDDSTEDELLLMLINDSLKEQGAFL